MKLSFVCPSCEQSVRVEACEPFEWQCPACDHLQFLRPVAEGQRLGACAVCENEELYKKKDFPHWLGMTILAAACIGSIIPYWLYHQWLTWTILIGSALFDGLLYLWVGDVVVCYRCNAHHRGLQTHDAHKPFELVIAERYRQERIRREQLLASKRAP